jgi:hypothetical protein
MVGVFVGFNVAVAVAVAYSARTNVGVGVMCLLKLSKSPELQATRIRAGPKIYLTLLSFINRFILTQLSTGSESNIIKTDVIANSVALVKLW